jgi:CRISPR-associated protein Csb2
MSPFIPPRYLKRRGKNTLEGQIAAELATRGLPPATAIEDLGPRAVIEKGWHRYVRRCRDQTKRPAPPGIFALRITFPEPQCGPICLGWGSHYGFGVMGGKRP